MRCGHRIAGRPELVCLTPPTIAVVDDMGGRTLLCQKHFMDAIYYYLYDGPNETITVGPAQAPPSGPNMRTPEPTSTEGN